VFDVAAPAGEFNTFVVDVVPRSAPYAVKHPHAQQRLLWSALCNGSEADTERARHEQEGQNEEEQASSFWGDDRCHSREQKHQHQQHTKKDDCGRV
jgi:hypothetical protein